MVDPQLFAILFFAALIVFGAAGTHIAVIMFGIGLVTASMTLGLGAVLNLGNLAWSTQNDFILVAIPLFILLGEILLRSGISERMYRALASWTSAVPGGLIHTNIVSCALFAATSGSSIATAATIGTVALPAFRKRRYDERLVLGSLAAGGTLGILIPPSINMIVYGAMTGTSIGRLFAAGIVPGVLLAGSFMIAIFVIAVLRPEIGGTGEPKHRLGERLVLLLDLLPLLFIFALVMGSIYFGFATATEAAALGVIGALFLAAIYRRLSIRMLHDAFKSTARTTAMVMLVVVAAFFLNFVLSILGIPQSIVRWVQSLGISPMQTIWILFLVYLVLGCFLETLSMIVTTIPIVTPLVVSLGYDPVWFGVFVTLMAELALITPPVGMNLYVIHSIRGPGHSISDVIVGVIPFLFMMVAVTAILIFFPGIALWLPGILYD